MNRVESHYQQKDADVRGLFYTLGFNINENRIATSVMNPDNSELTDDLWRAYLALNNEKLTVRVKNTGNRTGYSDVTISKNSYATGKSYVDRYFSASGDGLATAFQFDKQLSLYTKFYFVGIHLISLIEILLHNHLHS